MLPGELAVSDHMQFRTRITVGNVTRRHSSWRLGREIVGDLPEAVVSGAGIKQADGVIVWNAGEDLTEHPPNPWNGLGGWTPKSGEFVVIYVSDGVNEWVRFAGVIDRTTGTGTGGMQSTIIDYTDYLDRPVTHETVLRLHPPKTEGGAYMGVGMGSAYPVDRAFREAGFYATPRKEPGVVLSVPCQMTMWPEYGTITAAGALAGTSTHADNRRTSWGWCVSDFTASYTPQGTITPSDPVQLTARIAVEHNGNFFLTAWYGSTKIQLAASSSRTVIARLDGVEITRITLEPDKTIVTLLVKNGTWTLKTSGGATGTGTAAIPAGSNMTAIITTGDDLTRVAGIQVSKPPAGQEFQSLGHSASAFQHTSLFAGLMDVLPSYVDKTARALLTEVSKANLAPFWFTESGQLRMIGSDVLRAQAPVQTVTTADDIFDLAWEDSRLSVRSRVTVKYSYPAINRSRYSNILLWQGSGETMESEQEKSLFAETPADEAWAEIDHFAVGAEGLTAFNQGRGTWSSGFLEDSAGGWTGASGYYSTSLQKINERTRLFNVNTLVLPAGKKFVLATPDDATNYFPRMRGMAYPVLRGRVRVKFSDMKVTGATLGPAGFPELEHDAGPWGVQVANTIIQERIADYISAAVSSPVPAITGLSVAYDPRRQLGDVITIVSPKLFGISINALIIGVREGATENGGHTHELSVRIISATSTATTYSEFETAHPDSLTYEQWRLLFPSTATYSTFNNDPLRGA